MRRFRAVRAPRALVFALVVVVMSLCVADGVRMTPAGAQGSTGGLHDGTAPPSAANGSTAAAAYDDNGAGQTALQVKRHGPRKQQQEETEAEGGGGGAWAAAATGSRLPDCTHACGPCSPCRRVMVSLRCAEAAESCPIAYRCMCRGRFFRVPTL
uniref:Epidermal patterning factor-like protein n=1 Tax=Leersia perrieri TaxID=77586 RepID=A0A0D9W5R6_9ORYZ